jgi:hypothetical protein
MSRAPLHLRRFALRLMKHESDEFSDLAGQATIPVIDKLRPEFVNLMGAGGFRALLSRALALGSAEVRWLHAVHVERDGTLEGLNHHAQLRPAEFTEGKVVLLARVLESLVALIGPNLTERLLLDIWPKLSLSDRNFGEGETHENEK